MYLSTFYQIFLKNPYKIILSVPPFLTSFCYLCHRYNRPIRQTDIICRGKTFSFLHLIII